MPTPEQKQFLRRHAGQNAVNNLLLDWMEEIVATVEDLRAAVQEMQNAGAAASQEIKTLTDQITALHQNGPDAVSQEDLDALVNQVHAATTTLTTATQAAQGAPTGAASATTPPTVGGATGPMEPGGGTPVNPGPASAAAQSTAPGEPGPGQGAADTQTQTTPATGATQTTPPAAATDPAQAGATPAPTSGAAGPTPDNAGRTMYVTSGDDNAVNVAVWPEAPYRTTSGQQLHYFSGDTSPGDQNGANEPSWSVYTGGIVATG